jgi:hypothetical protein
MIFWSSFKTLHIDIMGKVHYQDRLVLADTDYLGSAEHDIKYPAGMAALKVEETSASSDIPHSNALVVTTAHYLVFIEMKGSDQVSMALTCHDAFTRVY